MQHFAGQEFSGIAWIAHLPCPSLLSVGLPFIGGHLRSISSYYTAPALAMAMCRLEARRHVRNTMWAEKGPSSMAMQGIAEQEHRLSGSAAHPSSSHFR